MRRHYLITMLVAGGLLAVLLSTTGESVAQSKKNKTGPVIKIAGPAANTTQESQTYDYYKAGKAAAPTVYFFNLPKTLKADEKDYAEFTIKEVKDKKADLIAAWKKLFLPPEGFTIDEVTRVSDPPLKAASGSTYTVLSIRGSYTPESSKKLDGYLMLCAFFEGKDANYEFRLVGPQGAVSPHQSDFYDILKSFQTSK